MIKIKKRNQSPFTNTTGFNAAKTLFPDPSVDTRPEIMKKCGWVNIFHRARASGQPANDPCNYRNVNYFCSVKCSLRLKELVEFVNLFVKVKVNANLSHLTRRIRLI